MKEVTYSSTRGEGVKYTASMAVLKGLASDGGLFVPAHIPSLDKALAELAEMDYQNLAYEVMKLFLTDYTEDELRGCIARAYDSKFDTPEIAPLSESCGSYYLELWHGATIAFKDMALSLLPHLMTTAAKKNGLQKEIVILTATSGDTGKAALAGFADVPGTRIVVFYPKSGVSPIQEKQMVTQRGDNTLVVGIHGNFDDAQTGVKKIFGDTEFAKELDEKGFVFSSANSINIGRLVPQVCYYVYAYTRLLKEGRIKDGELINVCVPTGNFGNILAAFYAKLMGLPVGKLICASNTNIAGNSSDRCAQLMSELSGNGNYTITDEEKKGLADFYGGYADEKETADQIKKIYEKSGYVIDTHTAVASYVCDKYKEKTGDDTPVVIASTASPYKFTRSVMNAIDPEYDKKTDFELIDDLAKLSNTTVPQAIEDIRSAPVLHKTECDVNEMKSVIAGFLK